MQIAVLSTLLAKKDFTITTITTYTTNTTNATISTFAPKPHRYDRICFSHPPHDHGFSPYTIPPG
jgi:hypothetical protein